MVKNYFTYAENDYKYFKKDYNSGRVADYMGAMGQNICERYLKHIVEQNIIPQNINTVNEKQSVLHSHGLNKLIKFIEKESTIKFTKDEKSKINSINGFYFQTRYPGDDSIDIDKSDLEACVDAIEICRDKALQADKIKINPAKDEDYEEPDL